MQSFNAKQTNNEQSNNQSNQGGGEYGTIIGPSVKSEPGGCRCLHSLNFTAHTPHYPNSASYDQQTPNENNHAKFPRLQGCEEGTKSTGSEMTGGEEDSEGKEGKSGGSHASPLPSDIPTLESLAQSSPKLSTWRQTRIISEKLEQVRLPILVPSLLTVSSLAPVDLEVRL